MSRGGGGVEKNSSRRKYAALVVLLIAVVLVYELYLSILAIVLQSNLFTTLLKSSETEASPEEAGEGVQAVLKQLGDAVFLNDAPLEQGYVAPEALDADMAKSIWLSIAPYVSLGYDESELVKALSRKSLPIKIGNTNALINYSGLRIRKNFESGSVVVEIPLVSDKPLPSILCNVTGVRRFFKLFNVTSIRVYRVSISLPGLFDAIPGDDSPITTNPTTYIYVLNSHGDEASSKSIFNVSQHGLLFNLTVLELREFRDIGCFWLHINGSLVKARGSVVSIKISQGDRLAYFKPGWASKEGFSFDA